MKSSFKIAFGLRVFHTYFEMGLCNCLSYAFAGATSQLADRYGIKMLLTMNGFDLYINTTEPLPQLLAYIGKTTGLGYFEFSITSTTAAFPMFTDLPLKWMGQVNFDTKNTNNKNEGGALMLAPELKEETGSACLGTLRVYFDYLCNNVSGTGAALKINFIARQTQWQYYVVNRSQLSLDAPVITGKNDVLFTGPDAVTLPNGEKALLFSSAGDLLALAEKPKYKFDLVNARTPAGDSAATRSPARMIFKGLPVPEPMLYGTASVNNQHVVSSPIYVYV